MEEVEDLDLPSRLIAAGEEPIGERINAYSKMKRLCSLLDALDEKEKEYLRRTQFRNLLDFPNQPAWSASFGIFLLGRRLDVAKTNEIWIVFAGTPVRFSLREFYLVTALRCHKYPTVLKKRKKNTAGKKISYYSQLFGLEEDVTVDRVITMLKKRTVTDEELRKRYACLAIVDGYVMPTSEYPKISKEHAEKMEDLDAFLGFPWGRASFEVMIKSIKERDVEQLATTCVAVQGLVYALQLAVMYAAPSIQEGPIVEGIVGSESEDESDEGTPKRVSEPFKLGQAKEIDAKCTAKVDTVIFPQCDTLTEDLTWSDEEEDPRVDNMLRLAKEGFKFTNAMFPGGCIPSQMEVAPKKQKRATRGQAVRTRKSAKGASNQTFTAQASSSRDAFPGPQYVDINALSRMLDDKLASQQQKIIDAVISWFDNNVSVSGDKAGFPKGGYENQTQKSHSTGQAKSNPGGRGYVFSDPSTAYGEGTTENTPAEDVDANPNPSVSLHGGVGVQASFYRKNGSGNSNASAPVHPQDCDDLPKETDEIASISAQADSDTHHSLNDDSLQTDDEIENDSDYSPDNSAEAVGRSRSRKTIEKTIENPKQYLDNPNNICFETSLNKHRKYALLVPAQFVKDYCLKFGDKVDYIDRHGKLTAEATIYGDQQRVVKKWHKICNRNNLTENDSILCEVFRNDKVVYAIKIHIIRDGAALT